MASSPLTPRACSIATRSVPLSRTSETAHCTEKARPNGAAPSTRTTTEQFAAGGRQSTAQRVTPSASCLSSASDGVCATSVGSLTDTTSSARTPSSSVARAPSDAPSAAR